MFFISNGSLLSVFLASKSVNYFWDSMKDANKSKNNVDESNNNETQLLREKLEAIRSMEKHLDESGDAN